MNKNTFTIDINFLQKYGLYINLFIIIIIYLIYNNTYDIINLFKQKPLLIIVFLISIFISNSNYYLSFILLITTLVYVIKISNNYKLINQKKIKGGTSFKKKCKKLKKHSKNNTYECPESLKEMSKKKMEIYR